MNLDEAKRIIDRAWNSGPRSIDWNEVEEASMVIVAETGTIYVPDTDDMAPWPRRRAPRAAAPSSRGTKSGYDAGARRGGVLPRPEGIINAHGMLSETSLAKTSRGVSPRERDLRDLFDQDEKPPGWP